MARRKEAEDQLRERILIKMREDIGISEAMAQPFVESVMRCFAGERLYFPALSRAYPIEEIRTQLERGTPASAVCLRFDLSRRQLNRLFPGGIPRVRSGA